MPALQAITFAIFGVLQVATASGYPRAEDTKLRADYDYIIVGAGASGLTVANRLTEDPAVTVLVIEAGDFDNNEDFMTVPGLAGGAVGTKYDWNLTYPASESLNGRNITAPLGKVVGGSTKLNRMVYDRGSKSDYDRWAELGNSDWQWKSLLPYFKKNEKFTPATAEIKKEYGVTIDPSAHGSSGFIHSTYSPFFWPTTKNFFQATGELDIGISVDQANGNAIGGYFCPHNINPKTVARSSAQDYYTPVSSRRNLQLLSGHQVTRVLTKKNGKSVNATGVEFAKSKDSKRKTVQAKKEVILAAGSIHTPQILQVSGIGDPALLSSINVPTVVNLPAVGQNFHDHVLLAVISTINAPLQTGNLTSNATFAAEARALYDSKKKGPYTSPTGDFLLFLPLLNYTGSASDIHEKAISQDGTKFLPSGTPSEVVKGYKKQQKVLNDKLLDTKSAILEVIWSDGAAILGLQHPYSRGSVKATSSSIFDSPEANPELLKNPLDVALLVEGVRFARKLSGAPSIKTLSPLEILPGADVTSDSDIENFVRSSASTLFHPAGSCKIGSRSEGGCVDEKLRVYGVKGLRVVDASIMPLLPATHTMTTVYAMAEKAADLIKQAIVSMDVFATLPPELIALVLGNLPNLEGLFNIVKASPSAYRFLDSSLGATTLDEHLDSWGSMTTCTPMDIDGMDQKGCVKIGDIGTTPWVPYILRLVALVRCCSAENPVSHNLTSFILKFMPTESVTKEAPELRMAPPSSVPNIRLRELLNDVRPFSACQILFLIRKVLVLTNECFYFFLGNIKAARPQHPAGKPSKLVLPTLWGHRPDGQCWGQPYEIDVGGEASWYEAQRIILGFCGLQLRYELSNAIYEGRLDWPIKDVKAVRSMGRAHQCAPEIADSNIFLAWEPMWAVAIYVASLKESIGDISCVGDTDVERNGSRVFFDTGFQSLEERHLRLPQLEHEDSCLEWPSMPIHQPSAIGSFFSHCEIVISGSKGFRWATAILCPPHGRRMTEGLLFRPLRRLGFGIWDDERMARMEMIDDPNSEWDVERRFHLWGEDQAFTWASLLSPVEKEELQAYQEALRLNKERKIGIPSG
ncbi:hypothetical protein FLONG3_1794 [Fusarium longipes]|uniref:Glucose-methanol-choline oxidoreductase N-terminal domain-containing protein n=1 Tax=Fusarium longipes TaxID=694270 RepID=A0A395T5J1_9HYPO|nr:hypothetical protein FLONG3_1794 [Fusarium longipes]